MRHIIAAIGFCLAFSIQVTPQHPETQKVRQSPASEVKAIPPEMTRRFGALRPKLQPTASAWVNQQAHALAQKTAPDLHALEIGIRGRFGDGNNLSDSDLEAVAFIVMMQATNDMDKDLKAIMDEVKSMTAAKAKLRDLINQVNKEVANNNNNSSNNNNKQQQDAPCLTPLCRSLPSQLSQLAAITANLRNPVRLKVPPNLTRNNLRALENELQQSLDSMNEVSEMTSMRLQMMMDRRSKFISTLSNIMKKIETTSETVVQNLK